MGKKLKCWEFFDCGEKLCPVYTSKELRCWLVSGTLCRNEIQGEFLEKIELCLSCEVFKANIDLASLEETLRVVNDQFTEFRQLVAERDEDLGGISMELALGLSEVFEALKEMAAGNPAVRIPETSDLDLIRKLKHMVNLTAENIGEMVDLSHEFAIGLAEHFDVLHRVSMGDLDARVLGGSKVELIESLKDVMNLMIESVAREMRERERAEKALQKAHHELEMRVEERTKELTRANVLLKQEVADRKRAEEAFRDSEQKYRTIFEDSRDAVYVKTREGRFIDVNQSALDLFGYTREQMLQLNAFDIHVNPETWQRFKEEIEEKGSVRDFEVKFRRKDGAEMDCLVTSSLRQDKDGAVLGYQGFIRDITERKRLEAQLQQAQKFEAIGTLAGGVAHDFNNLLMGIQGHVSLVLMDTDDKDPHYERLKSIEKQIKSGARLTSHLLGYARKGRYEVKAFSLNGLVQDVCETFGRTKREITVVLGLSEDLSPVEADPDQIEQVLFNLFINAADAMPNGGKLVVKTANTTDRHMEGKLYMPKPGDYVLLEVADTGMGMDETTMNRIFDPFFTTKERGRGTGLGMASAYGIIKSHNGYIDVDSIEGQGTTFTIYLPASEKEVSVRLKRPDPIAMGSETVLLVDDEDTIREVGGELLESMGYRVLLAGNGEQAIDIYRDNQEDIDVVLLDMVMPSMGGGEAYDRLKEIDPQVKVLLSSGFSIDGEATKILARGCDGFIQKPFTMRDLAGRIKQVLGRP